MNKKPVYILKNKISNTVPHNCQLTDFSWKYWTNLSTGDIVQNLPYIDRENIAKNYHQIPIDDIMETIPLDTTFLAELQFVELIANTNKSAYSVWQDIATKTKYPSFLRHTEYILQKGDIVSFTDSPIRVVGYFGFEKRGSSQSIKLIES